MSVNVRKNRSHAPVCAGLFERDITEDYRHPFMHEDLIMFYALNWFTVFGLLALWSLAAWAFQAVAAWTISQAGVVTAGTGTRVTLPMPEWLAPWVPAELASVISAVGSALAPAIDTVLGWAPALAGALSVLVWVVWGLGSAALIGLGLLISGAIAVLRGRQHPVAAPFSGAASLR